MTRIQIFESARSEAGRNAAKRLEAMADIARTRGEGTDIEHYEFASDAPEFLRNPQVKAYIDTVGADALPLVLIDGQQALAGRYPTRAELALWSAASLVKLHPDSGDCCSGGHCG
ncbi:MAG: arsenic metallochaperone ArsD family protein [Burkholderiaceae bacterium]|nr:arsenic metallochaperone ArsD family protein [Burkholderiaceae bacterium]MEB2350609.1 arsenic metallochaperone ArsD family protein [Burkholderiaceae bacterium]